MDSDLMRWVKAQADDPNANPRFRELYAAMSQQPAADPRSTHRVWRGDDWQPCYCEATNDHRIGSEQPVAVDETAAIRAFEEHFEASAEDPSFEGELELWLTAWRKALDSAPQQPAAVDGAVGTVTRVGSFEVLEHRIELDPDFDERLNNMPEGTVVRLYAAPVRDLTQKQLADAAAALAPFTATNHQEPTT